MSIAKCSVQHQKRIDAGQRLSRRRENLLHARQAEIKDDVSAKIEFHRNARILKRFVNACSDLDGFTGSGQASCLSFTIRDRIP